jgi:FdhD protein
MDAIVCKTIVKYRLGQEQTVIDYLACEEPLEINISTKNADTPKTIAITMRTPGQDKYLALGFLFTEGIITHAQSVINIIEENNRIILHLYTFNETHLKASERNLYTTSSCGVCGKTSIDAVFNLTKKFKPFHNKLQVTPELIMQLPELVYASQKTFNRTGGIHAAALFSVDGKLLSIHEDVGRHNALDKLIGYHIANDPSLFNHSILLLSGRAGFELIQKAAVAGILVIASVGAPSSLALELAEHCGITLTGFVKSTGFNIYTHHHRIIRKHQYENSH